MSVQGFSNLFFVFNKKSCGWPHLRASLPYFSLPGGLSVEPLDTWRTFPSPWTNGPCPSSRQSSRSVAWTTRWAVRCGQMHLVSTCTAPLLVFADTACLMYSMLDHRGISVGNSRGWSWPIHCRQLGACVDVCASGAAYLLHRGWRQN